MHRASWKGPCPDLQSLLHSATAFTVTGEQSLQYREEK